MALAPTGDLGGDFVALAAVGDLGGVLAALAKTGDLAGELVILGQPQFMVCRSSQERRRRDFHDHNLMGPVLFRTGHIVVETIGPGPTSAAGRSTYRTVFRKARWYGVEVSGSYLTSLG